MNLPTSPDLITVCMLTKNSEKTLRDSLSSLQLFKEVILLDTGSTDQTLSIARTFPNVRLYETPFTGFGELRNQAASFASNDWILALDSDEALSSLLQNELTSLTLDPECLYEIQFLNFYRGKRILGCGWHPESHIRIYHRQKTSFTNRRVHEGIIVNDLRVTRLRHPIFHTPYRSIADFIAKMQHYSDLFVEEKLCAKTAGKSVSSSMTKAVMHALAAFFKSYFMKRGFLDGSSGLLISLYNANTALYKYLKLAEALRGRDKSS